MERVRASSTFELISFWEIQRRVISGGCYDLFLCRLSLRSVQVSNLSLGHVVMMIQTATTIKMDIMKRIVKMIFIMSEVSFETEVSQPRVWPVNPLGYVCSLHIECRDTLLRTIE